MTETKNMPNLEKKVEKAVKIAADRQPSATYTLKSFRGVIQKLITAKMVTEAEGKTLKELHKTVLSRWIGLELGN